MRMNVCRPSVMPNAKLPPKDKPLKLQKPTRPIVDSEDDSDEEMLPNQEPYHPPQQVPHFGDRNFHEMIEKFRKGAAEKSANSSEYIDTPRYNLAKFPEAASFSACHGSLHQADPRITCCKLMSNIGIIHMEKHSKRKLSTTRQNPMVS